MPRLLRIAVVALAAATFVAACGDDDNSTSVTGTTAVTSTPATTASNAAQGAATTAAPASAASVTVAKTSLGDVLADSSGRTLYAFTVDGPDKSNCTGGCLQAWPRYTPSSAVAATSVTATVAAIDVDGAKQVTVNRMPLYYFAADAGPGDVKGQGVGGNWWVVTADGTLIKS